MTAKNANDDFDDELLSAYVDGELTAAERALVEERMRNDPAAATLVEELRALSSAVKALPRETLGRDLPSDVLAEIAAARDDLAKHGPATPPEPPLERGAGIRRGLLWSALAIAATVLIALFQPAEEGGDGRDLARSDKRDSEVKSIEPREPRPGDAGAPAKSAAVDKLSEKSIAADADALPPGLRGSISGDQVAGPFAAGEAEESAMAPASAPESPAPLATPMLAEEAAEETFMFKESEREALAAAAPAEAPAADTMASAPATVRRQARDGALELSDAPATMATPLASSPEQEALSGEPLQMGRGGAFAPRGGAMLESGAAAKPSEPAGETSQVAQARAATVTLKLASPDATQRFEQLLAECEIAPADVAGRKKEGDAAETGRLSRSAADASQQAAAESDRSLYFFYSRLTPQLADGTEHARRSFELQRSDDAERPAGQAVWVEATPAQIEALVAKCREDKEAFAAVVADGTEASALSKRSENADAATESKDLAARRPASNAAPLADGSGEVRQRVLFLLEPATSK